ncbi:MAG: hypothetical protein LBT40_08700, partial [Deltaproteobacteria bacterium]|nr:hypothetical protein [Deltaproteobacteria bacterium]
MHGKIAGIKGDVHPLETGGVPTTAADFLAGRNVLRETAWGRLAGGIEEGQFQDGNGIVRGQLPVASAFVRMAWADAL